MPNGYTFAIATVNHRGFAYLQRGAYGLQRASYYFQGSPETASSSHTFNGPMVDNFDVTDVGGLGYSPCSERRNLNINSELRVRPSSWAPKAHSFMAMDSTDAEVRTLFHIDWKRC